MEIIRTETEYKKALSIASGFFDNPPATGSPESEQFKALLAVIVAYEEKHSPIDVNDL